MDDYLLVEDALIKRLSDEMPELKAVFSATDLSVIQSARKTEPAAYVVYLGDQVSEGSAGQGGNGGVQITAQVWMVVLVVKFAGGIASGKGVREKAGPLIAKLLSVVSGWTPDKLMTPLKRTQAPSVGYDDGYGFYPFAFKTSHAILGRK